MKVKTAEISRSVNRVGSGWSQNRRLEFIDFRLRWDGQINRGDLTEHFGISVPQASLDMARYLQLAPANLEYDRSSRAYVVTEAFKPLFPTSDTQQYLSDLLFRANGGMGVAGSLLGWLPPFAAVPTPARRLEGDLLAAILRAIRNQYALSVQYQSMSRPAPTTRILTPTAIAHDGFRWHVRAFCHTRKGFRDFVIARILKINQVAEAGARPEDDAAWHNMLQLVLAPHPELPLGVRRAIEYDYGMAKGRVTFECREALFFYVLRHLNLMPKQDKRPEAQQIVLCNADALKRYIAKVAVSQEDTGIQLP